MSPFTLAAALLTLAAIFGFINYRFLRLPMTIALMLMGLVTSLVVLLVGQFQPAVVTTAQDILTAIDFDDTLLQIMLGYLLFAGALHVDLDALAKQKKLIAILATLGVVTSTFLVGTTTYFLLPLLGLEIPFLYCLLFGAL
ncbi:MAG: cation:proton antiporter, partial [Verrucomicrobiales bacterium]|nr:cation:proton antiporter [Verrucomicrobiales bacterium]